MVSRDVGIGLVFRAKSVPVRVKLALIRAGAVLFRAKLAPVRAKLAPARVGSTSFRER